MRVAFVLPFYADDAPPTELLTRYPVLAHLPKAVAARGHRVRVLCHAPYNARLAQGGVTYEFVAGDPLTRAAAGRVYRAKQRYGPAYFELAWRLAPRLRRLRPDVVHVFGLSLDLQLALLGPVARVAGAKVVVHFHGGVPDARLPYLRVQRWNGRWIDRVLFTTQEQSKPWIAAGVLRPAQAGLLVESSSPFRGVPREEARRRTGMVGDPVLLCAGSLRELKDPLTVLRGFARIAAELPDARLYFYYLQHDMLPEVHAFLDDAPEVATRVELRGRAPLAEMEAIYSSADFLLQASRREWSGLAILEAMSCGCIPIITDIPPFRVMTADGRYGRLFPIGDDAALAEAVLDIDPAERAVLSRAITEHFDRELSFAALASQLERIYRELTCPPTIIANL